MKKSLAVLAALVGLAAISFAQGDRQPRGKAESMVDGNKVTIDYGRPALKGRSLLAQGETMGNKIFVLLLILFFSSSTYGQGLVFEQIEEDTMFYLAEGTYQMEYNEVYKQYDDVDQFGIEWSMSYFEVSIEGNQASFCCQDRKSPAQPTAATIQSVHSR